MPTATTPADGAAVAEAAPLTAVAAPTTGDDGGQARVRVFIRVRPFVERELADGTAVPTLRIASDCLKMTVLDPRTHFSPRESFTFDHCFWSVGEHSAPPLGTPTPSDVSFGRSASFAAVASSSMVAPDEEPPFANQAVVFDKVGADVLTSTLAGFNACIFAYGQTGSGKTHTMMGVPQSPEDAGLIPRLGTSLFERITTLRQGDPSLSFRIECGYYEVYNERVFDLLTPSPNDLKVRQDPVTGPFVDGLAWHHVSASDTILDLINAGNTARHTAATKMNDRSSRSHAILCLMVHQSSLTDDGSSDRKSAKLNLVDLAGSERTSQSGVEGSAFREATKINLSLTTLGRVIDSLSETSSGRAAAARPPYRDSQLTWLLMDSLGGNSKTAMIATLSPAGNAFDEMMNTLRYAARASNIVNTVVVNADPTVMKIRELTAVNEKLRRQVQALSTARVTKEQLDEVEKRSGDMRKRCEELLRENQQLKSNLNMRDASLVVVRQENDKLKAALAKKAKEGGGACDTPTTSTTPTKATTFGRSASHVHGSATQGKPEAFSRSATALSSAPISRRGSTAAPGLPPPASDGAASAAGSGCKRCEELEEQNKRLRAGKTPVAATAGVAAAKRGIASPDVRTPTGRRASAGPSSAKNPASPHVAGSFARSDSYAVPPATPDEELLKKKDAQLIEATRRTSEANRAREAMAQELEKREEELRAELHQERQKMKLERVSTECRNMTAQLSAIEKRHRDTMEDLERKMRAEAGKRNTVNSALRRDVEGWIDKAIRKLKDTESKIFAAITAKEAEARPVALRLGWLFDGLRMAEKAGRSAVVGAYDAWADSVAAGSAALTDPLRQRLEDRGRELFEAEESLAAMEHERTALTASLDEAEGTLAVKLRQFEAFEQETKIRAIVQEERYARAVIETERTVKRVETERTFKVIEVVQQGSRKIKSIEKKLADVREEAEVSVARQRQLAEDAVSAAENVRHTAVEEHAAALAAAKQEADMREQQARETHALEAEEAQDRLASENEEWSARVSTMDEFRRAVGASSDANAQAAIQAAESARQAAVEEHAAALAAAKQEADMREQQARETHALEARELDARSCVGNDERFGRASICSLQSSHIFGLLSHTQSSLEAGREAAQAFTAASTDLSCRIESMYASTVTDATSQHAAFLDSLRRDVAAADQRRTKQLSEAKGQLAGMLIIKKKEILRQLDQQLDDNTADIKKFSDSLRLKAQADAVFRSAVALTIETESVGRVHIAHSEDAAFLDMLGAWSFAVFTQRIANNATNRVSSSAAAAYLSSFERTAAELVAAHDEGVDRLRAEWRRGVAGIVNSQQRGQLIIADAAIEEVRRERDAAEESAKEAESRSHLLRREHERIVQNVQTARETEVRKLKNALETMAQKLQDCEMDRDDAVATLLEQELQPKKREMPPEQQKASLSAAFWSALGYSESGSTPPAGTPTTPAVPRGASSAVGAGTRFSRNDSLPSSATSSFGPARHNLPRPRARASENRSPFKQPDTTLSLPATPPPK